MRVWRVGTISMGIALLLLGALLFLNQFMGFDVTQIFLSWWPFIFIILGIEILVYLFLARKEKPRLQYDFLSILFIGLIGTIGLIVTFLYVSGIQVFIKDELIYEEKTYDLPPYVKEIPSHIKRIVLESTNEPIVIEGTDEDRFSIFGTYTKGKEDIKELEDYLQFQQKGDTLYVQFKPMTEKRRLFSTERGKMEATVLVPTNVKLEVAGEWTPIHLKPRSLKNNWHIENGERVTLSLEKNSDVAVSTKNVDEFLEEGTSKWETEEMDKREGSFRIGKGTYTIHIVNSSGVDIYTEAS